MPVVRRRSLWHALIGVALAASSSACLDTLDPGAWGTPRYVANFPGAPPMKFIPPIIDRLGYDDYVVWGALDQEQMRAYDAKRAGLWLTSGACFDVTPPQLP